ncbi:MAG: Selenide, water dikinase [Candidatus Dichloromethanomonas elyunquensis]|nr:MAG: Selenide, water dikinase [Candidatus Dichloromethanomonas elyunquensis]
MVDDPYSFGQIAAANALSDIYAMGAAPLTALNLVSFPIHKLDKSILLEILRGGREKINEAGAVLLGGHSIDDPEPKYGLAVTGLIHPDKILTNRDAQDGDYLILTKPLGIGIITTGIKQGIVSQTEENEAVEIMAMLNKEASRLALLVGVNACTDVTGFGLLGHLHEMMKASGLHAEIYTESIPVVDTVWKCLEKGTVPGGTMANLAYLGENVRSYCSENWKLILGDAQTSGGLLFAVPEQRKEELIRKLNQYHPYSRIVGRVYRGEAGKISIYQKNLTP